MPQDITIEDVHAGLREELNTFTGHVLAKAKDVSQFIRAGRISKITAEDAIEIEMDDALARIESNPADSAGAIEQLAYLYLARMVAARIASGAVLGSRDAAFAEAPKAPVKRKRRTKAQIAADEATDPEVDPVEPEVEPEVEPDTPTAEVLGSDQGFLAAAETTEPVEPVELAPASSALLNLL